MSSQTFLHLYNNPCMKPTQIFQFPLVRCQDLELIMWSLQYQSGSDLSPSPTSLEKGKLIHHPCFKFLIYCFGLKVMIEIEWIIISF